MSEEYKVTYSADALEDLRGIYKYLSEELLIPQTAQSFVDRIRSAVKDLNFMPSRHQLVSREPFKGMGMRQLVVQNFVVYYIVDSEESTVTVVRIIYGSRDIAEVVKSK